MGFCSLQHSRDRRSTHRGVSKSRYVPPSGFGYPLDGLLPPSPCRLCFTPAALLGFTLRSLPLSRGVIASPQQRTHVPFRLSVLPPPKRRAGPTGRGFWALALARVPGGQRGISTKPTGCSLGFLPSRVLPRKSWPNLRPTSSHALRRRTDMRPPAPQSLNRLPLGCTRQQKQALTGGHDNPLRVLAPRRSSPFK